jgi:hypothetical protein
MSAVTGPAYPAASAVVATPGFARAAVRPGARVYGALAGRLGSAPQSGTGPALHTGVLAHAHALGLRVAEGGTAW